MAALKEKAWDEFVFLLYVYVCVISFFFFFLVYMCTLEFVSVCVRVDSYSACMCSSANVCVYVCGELMCTNVCLLICMVFFSSVYTCR